MCVCVPDHMADCVREWWCEGDSEVVQVQLPASWPLQPSTGGCQTKLWGVMAKWTVVFMRHFVQQMVQTNDSEFCILFTKQDTVACIFYIMETILKTRGTPYFAAYTNGGHLKNTD